MDYYGRRFVYELGGHGRMIIGIDFDNTIFPTLEHTIDIYNSRHDAKIAMSDITEYSLYNCLDSSVASELIDIFNEKILYDGLKPMNGAIKVIETLINKGHKIYIATATDSKNLEWKEKLIEKFFPFIPKTNIIRIHQKELLNLDILIDDCMDQLTKGMFEKICFDYQWNQDSDKDYIYDIFRVHSWNEIINIIKKIERKNLEWETK